MTTQNEIKTFDDLSEKHSTWIIKYCSTTYGQPLFLVWYTDNDENSTDRLLTYNSGEIFAINSLSNLKSTLVKEINDLVVFDNLIPWLDSFKKIELVEYCTYDIASVTDNVKKNNLDIATIVDIINFINLYGDYAAQDKKNNYLEVYKDHILIKEFWQYYYDYIFWPDFNGKDKFEVWDIPKLQIDIKESLLKLNDIIRTFEDNIKQTEKAIC